MYSCMIVINHGIAAPVADAMTEEDVDVSIGYWIFQLDSDLCKFRQISMFWFLFFQNYLRKYGYMELLENPEMAAQSTEDNRVFMIKEFQRMVGIPQTGVRRRLMYMV